MPVKDKEKEKSKDKSKEKKKSDKSVDKTKEPKKEKKDKPDDIVKKKKVKAEDTAGSPSLSPYPELADIPKVSFGKQAASTPLPLNYLSLLSPTENLPIYEQHVEMNQPI